jgi:parvulin-like peptidyl-prolyl isomerase
VRNGSAVAARAAAAFAVVVLVSCAPTPSPAASSGPTAGEDGVLATVNGVAIREEDLRLSLAKSSMGEPTPEQKRGLVEGLVRKEVLAQRAEMLNLDADPRYLTKLRVAQAEVDAIRREELSDRFYVKEVVGKAEVTDAEARAYFDAHVAELGAEFHVLQILRRDRKEVEEMKAELDAGATFDAVAGRRFEGTPQLEKAPWDLGWLKWSQMPEAWHTELATLAPGAHTGIIVSGGRYWIIGLVEKRAITVDFESQKPIVVEQLKAQKVEDAKVESERSLRDAADVVFAPDLAGK